MDYREWFLERAQQQKQEIETITDRTFTIKLSHADVIRLFEKAADVGMMPEDLLKNFIGDLVYGTYTNGSDECMYANSWFDRCGFSMYKNDTFLGYLQNNCELNETIESYEEAIYCRTLEGIEDFNSKEEAEEHAKFYYSLVEEAYTKYLDANPNAESLEDEMKLIMKWKDRMNECLSGK